VSPLGPIHPPRNSTPSYTVCEVPDASRSENVLVYGDLDGNLVALCESRALELVTVHEAMGDAETWDELRSRIPSTDYDSLVASLDVPPAPEEAFHPDELAPIQDGDWPEWPQQSMLQVVPEDLQEALGSVEFSRVSGDCS
jgi:hypothetical protein